MAAQIISRSVQLGQKCATMGVPQMPRRTAFSLLHCSAAAWLGSLLLACPAVAQLRVVDYNTAGAARPSLSTVLAAMGVENVNGIAKAPDIFTLQEQETSGT